MGAYIRHRNPFVYFQEVRRDPGQANNIVSHSEWTIDLTNHLPRFSFVLADVMHDAHDCPSASPCSNDDKLRAADAWLRTTVSPLLSSPTFMQDGLLIIVFDESDNDNTHGGGKVALVLAGPRVKRGYRSTTFYQHESTFRLILNYLGIRTYPAAAAQAPSMEEFFQ